MAGEFSIPSAGGGVGDYTVTSSGNLTNNVPVNPTPPTIDSFSTDIPGIDINTAFVVTITGHDFTTNGTYPVSVSVDGLSVSIDSFTDTQIVATFSNGVDTAGDKQIAVAFGNPYDRIVASDVLVINGYSPTIGNVDSTITIYGSGFTGYTNIVVVFHQDFLVATLVDDKHIACRVPINIADGAYLLAFFSDQVGLTFLGTFLVGFPSGLQINDMFSISPSNGDSIHASGVGFLADGRTNVASASGFRSTLPVNILTDNHMIIGPTSGQRGGDSVTPIITFSDNTVLPSPFVVTFT